MIYLKILCFFYMKSKQKKSKYSQKKILVIKFEIHVHMNKEVFIIQHIVKT